jgi:hypothetical protein
MDPHHYLKDVALGTSIIAVSFKGEGPAGPSERPHLQGNSNMS